MWFAKSHPNQGAQEDFICGSDARKVNGFGVSSCGLKAFPHRVGLKITSLDLIGVLEDDKLFSKICDEDVVRKILKHGMPFLEVISGCQRKKYSRIMTTSIPTVPRSKISLLKDHVITDLNSRIFKLEVLVRKTKGVVVDKLEFSEEFPNLSP
ncbi:hypothetical protein Tco_1349029, partial [Tanacetum coccineum]